ncbi:MAG TPA: ABC transporter permease [Haliangiales bacterium]|nr:ABC transporter permease [Haliangiales bacterium]
MGRLTGLANALTDTFRASMSTLATNKLRSALTLLGIVIGIVSIVMMVSAVTGVQTSVEKDLAQLGSGVFQVQKWPAGFGPRNRAMYEKRKNFTLAHVQLLEMHCRECLRVAGEAWEFGESIATARRVARNGSQVAGGSGPEFFDNNGYALAKGRYFSEGEALSGADVIVLGADVKDLLFPDEDPLGQLVRVKQRPLRVIGVIERRGSGLGGSQDNLVVVPIATYTRFFGSNHSLNVTIQARDPNRLAVAQDEVVSLLRKARGVPPEAENDFDMFSNTSMQESFDKIVGPFAIASTVITGISLLIAGIGVMNIMLVSVTERTREIGIRRALGARRRRILGQFVLESVMLTSLGGVLGLVLGWAGVQMIRSIAGFEAILPVWAVVLALGVAGGVGLIFGIYPAYRASRLDPVEAMRHE